MKILSKNIPRWIILFIDIILCFNSLVIAYLLRFNFDIPAIEIKTFPIVFSVVLSVRILSFLFSRTYEGIIRYTGAKDAQRIFITILLGSLVFVVINVITFYFYNGRFYIPFSIIIIDFLTTTFGLISSRFFVKQIYSELTNPNKEKKNVIIYGAGESGMITRAAIDRDVGMKYKLVAFVDDDKQKSGKRIEQVAIVHSNKLEETITKHKVEQVIISIQQLPASKLNEITERCLQLNTEVLSVPPVSNWINGELSFKQIESVQIEDLLGRHEIKLDEEKIKLQLNNKIVLVSGAAGSIGSEIVRQVVHYNPKQVILLDQAESALYDIEFELNQSNYSKNCDFVVADIRNIDRLTNVFKTFKPEVIYHAAAYKHVPLMENNPSEAILTNVLGTKNMAQLAVNFNVETFVMVSTDKAVNPTNVMGASKRIAEIYTQSLNETCTTNFITTRFGNVLGSNGSVIPLFKRQIENGGPITVTHPEITRYFMTIAEACQLVLEAGATGKGGEIYVFDMGESVKIVDLAKKMIKLSGLQLDKDIKITYTGLRPGEKLFEELLNNEENTLPTHHSKILIAKVKKYPFSEVDNKTSTLIELFNSQDNLAIVQQMKHIVPEFKSQNSNFQQLD